MSDFNLDLYMSLNDEKRLDKNWEEFCLINSSVYPKSFFEEINWSSHSRGMKNLILYYSFMGMLDVLVKYDIKKVDLEFQKEIGDKNGN